MNVYIVFVSCPWHSAFEEGPARIKPSGPLNFWLTNVVDCRAIALQLCVGTNKALMHTEHRQDTTWPADGRFHACCQPGSNVRLTVTLGCLCQARLDSSTCDLPRHDESMSGLFNCVFWSIQVRGSAMGFCGMLACSVLLCVCFTFNLAKLCAKSLTFKT